jgi:hypothetical protein
VFVPWLPIDWKVWTFWLWCTSLTPGIKTAVDSDWFDGTEAQVDEIFKMPAPVVIVPGTIPVPAPVTPSYVDELKAIG